MNLELLLSIVGGLVASFKWIYEYSELRKWNKNKFLLEEVDKFMALESTKCIHIILDWNAASIVYEGEKIKFNDKIIMDALQTHNIKHSFKPDEVIIRKLFDEYFDNLTKFVILSKSKLITEDNLILFLEYWFDILSGDSHSKDRELIEQIHTYLDFYGYQHLFEFLVNNTQNK